MSTSLNYYLICGPYRSGSTILSEMLNQHSQIVCTNELNYFSLNYKHMNTKLTLVDSPLNVSVPPICITSEDNKQYMINYWRQENTLCYCDKYPVYVFRLEDIIKLYPNIKIIFLVRKPEDVLMSQVISYYNYYRQGTEDDHYWARSSIQEVINVSICWADFVSKWIKTEKNFDYIEIKYETLLDNISVISDFLCVNNKELDNIITNTFKPIYHNASIDLPEEWQQLKLQIGY